MSNIDPTDNLIDNQDLLDILSSDSDSQSELEKALTGSDDSKSDDSSIDDTLSVVQSAIPSNPGSGDVDTDLHNWFNGNDKIPSDNLNSYVSNSILKMDYGISRHTLANFDMMGDLGKFLRSAYDLMFDPNTLMGLSPDELDDRVKTAFTMYRDLAALNQRTLMSLKEYKLKSNTEDETDKLSMLLSSIPSDKLKALLEEISASKN